MGLPSPTSEPSCHSNTVITSSFFTANEKVKYERLAATVIFNPSSLAARVEREREERLISTHKPPLNDAIHPQPTCTSVSTQPWIRLADVKANLDNEFGIGGWLCRIK